MGVPFSCTPVHTRARVGIYARRAAARRGFRGGVAEGKGRAEKGEGALRSVRVSGEVSEGCRRASGHLPAGSRPQRAQAAGTGHWAPGSRRCVRPVPAPRRRGSGRNFAEEGGAAGHKLENGSALVSKFPCREHLAMIIISMISVKYNIIRDY